jgi:hypothetical protein
MTRYLHQVQFPPEKSQKIAFHNTPSIKQKISGYHSDFINWGPWYCWYMLAMTESHLRFTGLPILTALNRRFLFCSCTRRSVMKLSIHNIHMCGIVRVNVYLLFWNELFWSFMHRPPEDFAFMVCIAVGTYNAEWSLSYELLQHSLLGKITYIHKMSFCSDDSFIHHPPWHVYTWWVS